MTRHGLPLYVIALNLIALIVSGGNTSALAQQLETAPLALMNGMLIDGTGGEPVLDATIVICDGRISEIGPREEVVIHPDAQIIDVQGHTILPGFINAHVHLAFEAENVAAWVQAGVTTVRDVGSSTLSPFTWDEWIQAIYEGNDPRRPQLFDDRDTILNLPQYARIVAAGPIVTVAGGYPIPIHGGNLALIVNSPEDAHQKMSILLDAGAELIKIALESRWGLQRARLSQDEIETIVAVAHERGTIVTAHVGLAQDLQLGVDAGIDDAAHMVNDYLPDELITEMIVRDVYVVPTLAVKEAYGWLGATVENVRRFVMAGGKVALGDDYGNPGIELGMPVRDMELMEEAGMTPMQIIVAGTKHSAHVCNLEEEVGTLEACKIADVLIVQGDPLRDVHSLTNVWLVIKDGVVVTDIIVASVPHVCAAPGGTAGVSITMDNETRIETPIDSVWIELNFDDSLLSVIQVEATPRTETLSMFEWDVPSPGTLAVHIWDGYGNSIDSGIGAIARVVFAVREAARVGESTRLSFHKIELVESQEGPFPVVFEDGTVSFGESVRGDVDSDCGINILDVLRVVNIILRVGDPPTENELWTGDCSGDGVVNILDVVGIVNVILGRGECSP